MSREEGECGNQERRDSAGAQPGRRAIRAAPPVLLAALTGNLARLGGVNHFEAIGRRLFDLRTGSRVFAFLAVAAGVARQRVLIILAHSFVLRHWTSRCTVDFQGFGVRFDTIVDLHHIVQGAIGICCGGRTCRQCVRATRRAPPRAVPGRVQHPGYTNTAFAMAGASGPALLPDQPRPSGPGPACPSRQGRKAGPR